MTFARIFFNSEEVLPEFVKTASIRPREAIKGHSSSAFAGPGRSFPISDKPNIYISAAYAIHGGADPEVIGNIKRAASLFGISGDIENLEKFLSRRAEGGKSASGRWAIAETVDGQSYCCFGESEDDAMAESCRFLKRASRLPFGLKTKVAQSLIERAGSKKFDMDDLVFKYAGYAYPIPDMLEDMLYRRTASVPIGKRAEFSNTISALACHPDMMTPEGAMKVAEYINGFDEEFGIRRLYGSGVSEPHLSVFHVPVHKAAALIDEHSPIEVSGHKFTREQMSSAPFKRAAEFAIGADEMSLEKSSPPQIAEAIRSAGAADTLARILG